MVELVIVMAIMAILIGIVGTQVIPYIEKAKKAKDIQKISSYCTNAMSALASCAPELDAGETYEIVANKESSGWKVTVTDSGGHENTVLKDEFLLLNQLEPDGPKCISEEGKKIQKIIITCKNNRSYVRLKVLGPEKPEAFSAEAK